MYPVNSEKSGFISQAVSSVFSLYSLPCNEYLMHR